MSMISLTKPHVVFITTRAYLIVRSLKIHTFSKTSSVCVSRFIPNNMQKMVVETRQACEDSIAFFRRAMHAG